MSVPANFRLVGVTSDLLTEIEEEFLRFFPNSVNLNVPSATVDIQTHENDDETEIGSDDEDENVMNYDILRSPVIRSRILQVVNPLTTETPESEVEDGGIASDLEPQEDDNNRSDREELGRKRAMCGKKCLETISDSSIIDNRINVQGMDKDSRDMFIMGQLKGCGISKGSETRKGERKRHKFDYQFNNKSVCKACFLFVNNINTKYLKNVMKHYITEGAVPRVHGNTGRTPKHAVTYDNVQHIVQFLTRYVLYVNVAYKITY